MAKKVRAGLGKKSGKKAKPKAVGKKKAGKKTAGSGERKQSRDRAAHRFALGMQLAAAGLKDVQDWKPDVEDHGSVKLIRLGGLVASFTDRVLVMTAEMCSMRRLDLPGVYMLPPDEFKQHVRPLVERLGDPTTWTLAAIEQVAELVYESYGKFWTDLQQQIARQ